jgi:molybdopterin synthase sulfur carrier subunit
MKIQLLAFAIAKEIVGRAQQEITLPEGTTLQGLKAELVRQFPDFQKLVSLRLAVDMEYRPDHTVLQDGDEVAIIPPVSGG